MKPATPSYESDARDPHDWFCSRAGGAPAIAKATKGYPAIAGRGDPFATVALVAWAAWS